MIEIDTLDACSLFKTPESAATPCSVNTYGFVPPKTFFDGIAFCDTK